MGSQNQGEEDPKGKKEQVLCSAGRKEVNLGFFFPQAGLPLGFLFFNKESVKVNRPSGSPRIGWRFSSGEWFPLLHNNYNI